MTQTRTHSALSSAPEQLPRCHHPLPAFLPFHPGPGSALPPPSPPAPGGSAPRVAQSEPGGATSRLTRKKCRGDERGVRLFGFKASPGGGRGSRREVALGHWRACSGCNRGGVTGKSLLVCAPTRATWSTYVFLELRGVSWSPLPRWQKVGVSWNRCTKLWCTKHLL